MKGSLGVTAVTIGRVGTSLATPARAARPLPRARAGPSSSFLSTSLHSIPSASASSSSTCRRAFATTSRRSQYRFMLALAVQGKPGEPDLETTADGKFIDPQTGKALPDELQAMAKDVSEKRKEKNARKIGWPSDTPIGAWRDSLLGEAQAGEDAVMVAETQPSATRSADVAIGVADGVGSWSENGVDPALFSQALMYHASSLFSAQTSAAEPAGLPKKLLADAFKRVQGEAAIPAGSSTATILTMESSTGTLRTANLGDSGFIILRSESGDGSNGNETGDAAGSGAPGRRPLAGAFYRSAPQQYSFNAPYQLSKLPPKMLQDWKRQAREAGQDPETVSLDAEPAKADEYTCQLKHGDLVVVATDGVWDNVWGKEWVALVKFLKEQHHAVFQQHLEELKEKDPEAVKDQWLEEKTLVNVIAHNALQFTLHCQFSEKKQSPFEAEAKKNGIRYPGGKIDDVGIVVALVVDEKARAAGGKAAAEAHV